MLILSLSCVGVAFASWTQQLTINGSVSTTYISVKFGQAWPALETDRLNVGAATATILDNKHLQVTLHNVYPGYKAYIAFTTINDGPLPIIFSGVSLNGGPTSPATTTWTGTIAGGAITLSVPASATGPIPSGDTRVYGLNIEVGNVPLDGSSYSFTLDMIYQQGV